MNKVILVGNLGGAPEVRATKSGTPVTTISVATTEYSRDQEGNKIEHTEWHRVVVFGNQAENCGKYLDKGSKVAVEGSIRYRSYDKDDGTKGYSTEILADRVEFLSRVNAE